MSSILAQQIAEWIAKLPGTPFVYVPASGLFYHLGGNLLSIEQDVLRNALQGEDLQNFMQVSAEYTKSDDRTEYEPVGSDLGPIRYLLTSIADRFGYDHTHWDDGEREAQLLAQVSEETAPLVTRSVEELTHGIVGIGPRPPSAKPDEGYAPWLLRQNKRDDRVGDLARDLGEDSRSVPATRAEPLVQYLVDHGACEGAVASAWEAWSEYKTGFKTFILASAQAPLVRQVQEHGGNVLSELPVLRHVYKTDVRVKPLLAAYEKSVDAALAVFGPPVTFNAAVNLPDSLTLMDHVRIGATLKGFDSTARKLFFLHLRGLSPKHSSCALLKEIVDETSGKLRCVLDDRVCEEQPQASNRVALHCYYGEGPERHDLEHEGIHADA
jgi:hypothetical protein